MHHDDTYFTPPRLIARLHSALLSAAHPDIRTYLCTYHKLPSTSVMGLNIQPLRYAVHTWRRQWHADQLSVPLPLQTRVAHLLFASPLVEHQLASAIFVADFLLRLNFLPSRNVLALYEPLFARGVVASRYIADNFATKVLALVIERDPVFAVATLCRVWIPATDVWQARAALVALSHIHPPDMPQDVVLYGCSILIRRPEEAAKSAAGSALRTLVKQSEAAVKTFLDHEETLFHFTAPALKKATTGIDDRWFVRSVKDTRKRVQKTGLAPDVRSAAVPMPQEVMKAGEEMAPAHTQMEGDAAETCNREEEEMVRALDEASALERLIGNQVVEERQGRMACMESEATQYLKMGREEGDAASVQGGMDGHFEEYLRECEEE